MGHEQAADPVDDLLFGAVVARCYDGEACGAGFGDDVRHAFAAREPDEDVECGEQVGHVVAVAEEGQGGVEAERVRAVAECDGVFGNEGVWSADHYEAGAGVVGVDERGGFDEILDALFRV